MRNGLALLVLLLGVWGSGVALRDAEAELIAPQATPESRPPRIFAVRASHLVDVRNGDLITPGVVVVEGDIIRACGSPLQTPIPPGADITDIPGGTLLPGLIDCHVHLSLSRDPAKAAEATLRAGFTSVLDLGAVDSSVLVLRQAVESGRIVGPRIAAAGRWIGVSRGSCDFGGIGVSGADGFRKRVREQVQSGADVIKICVTGWIEDALAHPERFETQPTELEAAVAEAHRLGRKVIVHAISSGGIRAAIRAGADALAHSGFVDDSTAAELCRERKYLIPTLHSFGLGNRSRAVDSLFTRMRQLFTQGAPVAFGTDAGTFPHGQNGREFAAMIGLGLTPLQAIQAATVNAAEALGRSDRIGTLEPGKLADLVVMDGNPLQDPSALMRVRLVIKGGAVVK